MSESIKNSKDKLNELNIRFEFLKKNWKAYPKLPQNPVHWGRVINLREGFITLKSLRFEDFYAQSQIQLNNLMINHFSDWKLRLIIGDIICIDSNQELVLLVPNLLDPMNSLENQKILVRKNIKQEKWAYVYLWSQFLTQVRFFFQMKKFMEVNTLQLVDHPGSEPTLDVFETELRVDKFKQSKFLPTSPELSLKKILTSGVPRVFEITKSFRNGEITDRHQPEFHMIEWYRSFEDLSSIKLDVQELINHLIKYFSSDFHGQAHIVDCPFQMHQSIPSVEYLEISEILKNKYDFNFKSNTSFSELTNFCKEQGLYIENIDSMEDLFTLIMLEKIETQIDPEKLVFLEKYPPYSAALARKDNQGWAERFEVYWKNLEIANAFCELNDPEEQLRRFEIDNNLKTKYQLKPLDIDEDFLNHLQFGLPPCSGIALGLDRLFMALFQMSHISEFKLQSHVKKI